MEHFLTVKPYWGRRSAVVGSLVWILLFALQIGDSPETELIPRIVLLGILVVVPLGLSLAPGANANEQNVWLYRLALFSQPFGACAAVVSFLLTPGVPGGLLASLWFVVTAVIALLGLSRLGKPELFTGSDRKSILESCEFGEDAAQKAYNEALESDADMDVETRQLIMKQKHLLKS